MTSQPTSGIPVDSLPGAARGANRAAGATVQAAAAAVPQTRKPGRVSALDFTKGALVVFMVVYHSINYFHNDFSWLRYFHFVPPSFIMIAGFLITNIYLAKYDDGGRMFWRLFSRGVKLLAIFTLLNLVMNVVITGDWDGRRPDDQSVTGWLGTIYLTGQSKKAAFQVLVPISYLLVAAGVMAAVLRRSKAAWSAALVGLLAAAYVGWHRALSIPHLEGLTMGVVGMALGFIPLEWINRSGRYFLLIAAAYAGYVVLEITTWLPPVVEVGANALALLVLYAAGVRAGDERVGSRLVIQLGKYSLVGYIVQIGFLQVARPLIWALVEPYQVQVVIGFISTMAFTMAAVIGLDWLRRRWQAVDTSYRAVFG